MFMVPTKCTDHLCGTRTSLGQITVFVVATLFAAKGVLSKKIFMKYLGKLLLSIMSANEVN